MKSLYDICMENAPYRKIDLKNEVYKNRLDTEIDVICGANMEDYFFIVADFMNYYKRQGWYSSSARGSSAGSLVCYLLGITEVDPIPYNLLFERFLNKARLDGNIANIADIDCDLAKTKRNAVIDYIIDKYGIDRVAMIRNYNKFTFNNAFRMVSSAGDFNISYVEVNNVMKATEFKNKDKYEISFDFEEFEDEIDGDEEEMESLIEILNNPKNISFKKFYESNKDFREICNIASKLVGSIRGFGQHAAGIIIFNEPISNFAPIALTDKRTIVLQADKIDVEMIGGVKIDLLGLKTADVITETLIDCNIPLKDFSKIDLNDEVIYDNILSVGKTDGVFTMETVGMKDTLRKIKAHEFNDLSACQALYRPGAMDNIPDYVDVKINNKNILDIKPEYKSIVDIIEETYGVITYQEQAMRIVKEIANFTDSRADDMRKAIGKKKLELIDECGLEFIENAIISKNEANFIWEEIKKSGNYSFNKSHAVGYAMVSFACAYLIYYYSAYYFKNLLELSDNSDKIKSYIRNCPVSIKSPNIFFSKSNHTVVDNVIYFGLSKIKGVKLKKIESIQKYMEDKSLDNFNIVDFILKNDVDKMTFEGLIFAGAFDSLKLRRSVLSKISSNFMEILNKEKNKSFIEDDEDYLFSKNLSYFKFVSELEIEEQKKSNIKKVIKSGDITLDEIESITFDGDWKILKRTLNRMNKVTGYRRSTLDLYGDFMILYNSTNNFENLMSSIECMEKEKEYIGEVLSSHPDNILNLDSMNLEEMEEGEVFEMTAYLSSFKERKTKKNKKYYSCELEFKNFNIMSNLFGKRSGRFIEEPEQPVIGFYIVSGEVKMYNGRKTININNFEKL
ncbi:MAG: DNA polymerase III subunit alpha [Novosphingobium sp.]|nr:DNA polymerase III subunit alpha [Novosphingobium sp.]